MKDKDKTKGQLIDELIELRRRLAELKTPALEPKSLDELDVLSVTLADVSAEFELSRLFQAVLKRAVLLLEATGGDLSLYDEDKQELVIVASHNLGKDFTGTRMALGEGAMGCVAETRKPLIVKDYKRWESRSPQYQRGPWHAVLAAPMIAHNRLVGVIGIVESKPTRQFSPLNLRILNFFAQQTAIAVENARLFETVQRRVQEAETLREVGSVVAATLKQEEAIERILQQLARVVSYDSASVQLLGDGYVEIVGGRGWPDPAAVVGLRFPIPGDNPNTVVIQQRRSHILGDAPAAYPAFRENPHSHIRSFLGVPLIVLNRMIGMLAVDSAQPDYFSPEHARLATAFANQVAIAIKNAQLHAEVQQLAVTDTLTGLYNRPGFFKMGRREVKRAQRFFRSLSAIMLDLDHFKQVNDTYGDAVGDQVLVELAAKCLQELREVDLLGRYGGDEFAALLPEADLTNVQHVAERLRQRVALTTFKTSQGSMTITLSLGIATLDKGCADLNTLLDHADVALYAAKQAGRNQTSVWQD